MQQGHTLKRTPHHIYNTILTISKKQKLQKHQLKKILIKLNLTHLINKKLHKINHIERIDQLTKNPDTTQLMIKHKQLFFTHTQLIDVKTKKDTLLHELAIEVKLGVTRALELLEDDLVHATTDVNKNNHNDHQTTTFLNVTHNAKEAL